MIGDRAITKKEFELLAQRLERRIVALRVRTTGRVSNFSELLDTPASYVDQGNKFLMVHADEDRVTFDESSFLYFSDTPSDYSGQAGKGLIVNVGEDALEFTTLATSFVALADTPSDYSGQGLKILRVNDTPDAVEFGADLEDLEDVPTIAGESLKLLRVNTGETACEWVNMDDFLALADTPSAYTSQDDRYVKVNSVPDGLEFGRRIFSSDDAPTTEGDNGDIYCEY